MGLSALAHAADLAVVLVTILFNVPTASACPSRPTVTASLTVRTNRMKVIETIYFSLGTKKILVISLAACCSNQFQCDQTGVASWKCILATKVNDGVFDCDDLSDEAAAVSKF